jgi:hypothetical protein
VTGLEHPRPHVHLERLEGLQSRDPPVLGEPVGLLLRAREARVVLVAILGVVGDPLLELQRPARRAGDPLLGEDLDDAIGRLRAVERGRGRSLEHLDALDGGGIDVVEARRAAAALVQATHAAAVVDADPIHVDDRLLALRQAGAAADAQLGSLTRDAAGGQRRDARLASLQRLGEVGDWRLRQLLHVDARHGVAELLDLRGLAGAGHHHGLERGRRGGQLEVQPRRVTGGDRQRARRAAVADPAHADLDLAHREVAEQVGARGVGDRAQATALDEHLGPLQRPSRRGLHHGAAHRAGALGLQRRRAAQAEHTQAEHTQMER